MDIIGCSAEQFNSLPGQGWKMNRVRCHQSKRSPRRCLSAASNALNFTPHSIAKFADLAQVWREIVSLVEQLVREEVKFLTILSIIENALIEWHGCLGSTSEVDGIRFLPHLIRCFSKLSWLFLSYFHNWKPRWTVDQSSGVKVHSSRRLDWFRIWYLACKVIASATTQHDEHGKSRTSIVIMRTNSIK